MGAFTLMEEHFISLVILGNPNVGKKNFVHRLTSGGFVLQRNDLPQRQEITMWTNRGIVNFRTLIMNDISRSVPDTDCAIIMYDVTNEQSYDDCFKWTLKISPQTTPFVIIGNKAEPQVKRKVTKFQTEIFNKRNFRSFVAHHDISNLWNSNLQTPLLELASRVFGLSDLEMIDSRPLLPPVVTFATRVYG